MYKWIIFDLDGTLLDTLDDIADSVNAVLLQNGYAPKPAEQVRGYVGNGAKRAIEQALPDGTDEAMVRHCLNGFMVHYAGNLQVRTQPYPGIMELLDALKDMGVQMAVVSNKPDAEVKALSDSFFSAYMQSASGERAGVPQKPAPDRVFEAMEKMGAKREQTLYIGDAEMDVQTAKNAGLTCVAVSWGFRPLHVVEAENPEYIVHDPAEILPIVRGEG